MKLPGAYYTALHIVWDSDIKVLCGAESHDCLC